MFDVIIAGCGPTGAMLAAELRLHDVRVLVLEREPAPVPFVRIVGLHIRSLELMAMRGLLERVRERGRQRPAGAYFAAIDKPAPEGVDSAYAYLLGIPSRSWSSCWRTTRSLSARRSGAAPRWPPSSRTTTG